MQKCRTTLAILAIGAALVAGCSGGGKSTSPNLTTQEYEALRPAVDSMVVGLLEYLWTGANALDDFESGTPSSPRLGRLAVPADTGLALSYEYQNGWHILLATLELDSLSFNVAESLRFTDVQGTPQEIPDSLTTTALRLITHLTFTCELAALNGTLGDYVDFTFTGLQSATMVVNGDGRFIMDISGADSVGPFLLDLAGGIDADQVSIANPNKGGSGCVRGGQAGVEISGSFAGHDDEGHEVSGTADVTATIAFHQSGTAEVTVRLGNTQYTAAVDACPPD